MVYNTMLTKRFYKNETKFTGVLSWPISFYFPGLLLGLA